MNLKFTLIIAGLFVSSLGYGQEIARGMVYEDTNLNGKRVAEEKGIAQVAISNGVDVVVADASARKNSHARANSVFVVIKPNGSQSLVDENSRTRCYYMHKTPGPPVLKYTRSKPTGKLPKSVDFALQKDSNEQKDFSALVFGDPQAYNMDEISYFDKGIIQDIADKEKFSFGLSLGDLVGDDLAL